MPSKRNIKFHPVNGTTDRESKRNKLSRQNMRQDREARAEMRQYRGYSFQS